MATLYVKGNRLHYVNSFVAAEDIPAGEDYPGAPPHRFTGGTIRLVAIDVSGEPYLDLEREAAMMLARE